MIFDILVKRIQASSWKIVRSVWFDHHPWFIIDHGRHFIFRYGRHIYVYVYIYKIYIFFYRRTRPRLDVPSKVFSVLKHVQERKKITKDQK